MGSSGSGIFLWESDSQHMALPSLNNDGDLPVGIHLASMQEVCLAFGAINSKRENVFRRLERIYEIAVRTGHLCRFIIFGSFVTGSPFPNDVDIFMVFDDEFDASKVDKETMLILDHSSADAHFGASVFWLRRPAAFGGEQATIEFWKTKRDGTQRGIVEIAGHADD